MQICQCHASCLPLIRVANLQEDVPTLDLVDLPGVRASPPAAAKTSEELVKKYLNDPGTMVLLVVPATQSSFLNDKAMEIVRGLNKQSRTILALTKCDDVNKKNVNPDMVKDLLTDRILQAEPQKGVGLQKGKEFFGCVGIINRTHKDKVTLDQAAAEEFTKFTAKFGSSLTADQRTEVEDNITVTNLIKKIDLMFHHDICTNWKQVALKALAPQLEAVNKQLQRLGPPVSELTAQRVLDGVVGKVSLCKSHICYCSFFASARA